MVSTQKSVLLPQRISLSTGCFCQQKRELGVEEAVTCALAYPAIALGWLQRTVQLPTRGAGFQFATRQIIMLDIDDSPLLLPDMGRSPIDIGQHLLLLMVGLFHDPLLHIDDQ